eukprot:gnl/TRDRNA2_/TRDRNA2_175419_c2_seq2.p1 gnl/TRDRNA2_/TRDRNA2_175419_c2~~gnl/TRDRNA2_/TRDRNA2_175419_c2_seq2.p1  ORF type:complete len:661 (+),score=146.55 gnl/TRDRNA2_/TRDRNA2_175419_c2_seq2:53-1984(+)
MTPRAAPRRSTQTAHAGSEYPATLVPVRPASANPFAAGRRGNRLRTPKANEFTNLVERTVDAFVPKDGSGAGIEDVEKILAEIRRQFDEVHAAADLKEVELVDLRKELVLFDMKAEKEMGVEAYNYGPEETRESLQMKLHEAVSSTEEHLTTKRVYKHMLARLKKEVNIVRQKIKAMEDHLTRKTREVEKLQALSRRVHQQKVPKILELEAIENELEVERYVCNSALDDLESMLQQGQNETRRREDFERWRYEVAMQAATEAFDASAGRLRKIFAIEKLTGNYLQKVIFDQAEHSQVTEDGFQKIREVTGLTDVMDIVHKFLNRDVEHEQLKASVREAEMRLYSLREAEMGSHGDNMCLEEEALKHPKGMNSLMADKEQLLMKALQERDDWQKKMHGSTLLVENVTQWMRRMSVSLAPFEEIEPVQSVHDMSDNFRKIVHVIDRFLSHAHEEMPAAKLQKMTSQASHREYAERQRVLNDKDFIRANCRVPSSLEQQQAQHREPRPGSGNERHTTKGGSKRSSTMAKEDDDTQTREVYIERERLKMESMHRLGEKYEPERLRGASAPSGTTGRKNRHRASFDEETEEIFDAQKHPSKPRDGISDLGGAHGKGRPASAKEATGALPRPLSSSRRPVKKADLSARR